MRPDAAIGEPDVAARAPAEGRPGAPESPGPRGGPAEVILSFDVEEHFRIEAAAGLEVPPELRARYARRVGPTTYWLLDRLEDRGARATFFVVGQLAAADPALVRAIHRAGHEVASHGWDHRRVLGMTPEAFREDVRTGKDVLEQATGAAVVGYRAPTFSIVRRTAWALDVLADLGMLYDSSIYPVRHDRYGVPGAPRVPFLARGIGREILEIPPATLRVLGANLPVGGGGYFRLLPAALLEQALRQVRRSCRPPVAMLYFHPWEFDPGQPRLPLRRLSLSRFRTYVGIARSRERLGRLLARHRFTRAVDVARRLAEVRQTLPTFRAAD
jgi:polysaccharide deacetylase family protein (PEP-CTERM system associated)